MVFNRGDVICRSEPLVYVLIDSENGVYCNFCLRSSKASYINLKDFGQGPQLGEAIPKPKLCSQCKLLYFCDAICQRKAWSSFHKLECRRLKSFPLKQDALAIARLYMKLKLSGENGRIALKETVGGYSRTYDDLIGHQERVSEDFGKMYYLKMMISAKLVKFCPDLYDPDNEEDQKLLFDVYCKYSVNSNEIVDSGMEKIGGGLFLGYSIFDHSCDPDAYYFFNGTTCVVRAAKFIPHDDVKKITVSYRDIASPKAKRQEYLQDHYYFTCACPRCLNDEKESSRFQILNPQKAMRPNILALTQSCVDEANHKNTESDEEKRRMLKKSLEILEMQENVLGEFHTGRLRLLQVAFGYHYDLKLAKEGIPIGLKFLKVHKFYYGEYDFEQGYTLSKIAQLYVKIGNFKLAHKFMLKSFDVLKPFLDEDHPMFTYIKAFLDVYNGNSG